MKSVIVHSVSQRPFPLRLLLLVTMILASLTVTVIFWQIMRSPNGRAVFVLLKACGKLVPPLFWLGGLGLVTLWLTILGRVWRQ